MSLILDGSFLLHTSFSIITVTVALLIINILNNIIFLSNWDIKQRNSCTIYQYVNLLNGAVWFYYESNEDFTKIYLAFFLFEGF